MFNELLHHHIYELCNISENFHLHGICCSHTCFYGLITYVSHINTISPPRLSLNYKNHTRTFHLFHIGTGRFLRPAPLALRDVVGVAVDGRVALPHVEPPGVPPLQRCVQRHSKVLPRHSIAQLKVHSADHLGTTAASLLQSEQVAEEVEVRKDSEKCFTEMDEDRYVQYCIWVEVA